MKINFDGISEFLKTLDPHVITVGHGAAFFGIGILAGFVIKKYLRLMLLSAIICFFVIKGLEFQHVLNIEWGTLNQFFGLKPSTTLNEIAILLYAWSASHPNESIPGGVGIFIGFNLA